MDDGLKQRLVGAVVLAAVAVIFLPSFFDEGNRRRVDTHTLVPEKPGIKTVEIKDPVRPENIPQAKKPEQMYQMLEPTDIVDGKPESPALDGDAVPKAWVVQVASYQTPERAAKLRDQLLSEGYKAYMRTVKTAKGSVTRVFVGPKIDKQRALAIKDELDKALKVNTLVLRFRP